MAMYNHFSKFNPEQVYSGLNLGIFNRLATGKGPAVLDLNLQTYICMNISKTGLNLL